jgi:hypothetical protein
MFKYGLLQQAELDFKEITEAKPKKSYYLFNYALTVFQQGRYLDA